MKTPLRTIRTQAPRLCIALAVVAIAAPGAESSVKQSNALDSRLQIYPYEAPFGPDRSTAVHPSPLAGRLQIYPYEAPFGPDVSTAPATQPAEQ